MPEEDVYIQITSDDGEEKPVTKKIQENPKLEEGEVDPPVHE
jgi:hypothetical protein